MDRYHDEFQGPTPALHIARAAEEAGLPVRVNLVVPAGEDGLTPLIAPFEGLHGTRLRFYGLQAVGRARGLPVETLGGAVDGFCAACATPAVTDDGRMTACNGAGILLPRMVPAHRGVAPDGAARDPAGAPSSASPILETIRTFGPARLRDELSALPGFEGLLFRGALPRYLRPVPPRHIGRGRGRGPRGSS